MSSDESRGARDPRLPRNYVTILDTVRDARPGEHLTAYDVHARARAAAPGLGFATVHRGLTRLHELGYVLKVDVPGAPSAIFEAATSPHAHFRCTACGEIRDIDFTLPADGRAALAAAYGLEIAAETTTFTGRCGACRAND